MQRRRRLSGRPMRRWPVHDSTRDAERRHMHGHGRVPCRGVQWRRLRRHCAARRPLRAECRLLGRQVLRDRPVRRHLRIELLRRSSLDLARSSEAAAESLDELADHAARALGAPGGRRDRATRRSGARGRLVDHAARALGAREGVPIEQRDVCAPRGGSSITQRELFERPRGSQDHSAEVADPRGGSRDAVSGDRRPSRRLAEARAVPS